MVGAGLAVRFALELGALAALAWWGATLDAPLWLRIVAAVAAPLAGAAVWGAWVAPKAAQRLADPARFAVETAFWVAAAAALWAAWSLVAAVAFLALALGTAALVRVRPEPV